MSIRRAVERPIPVVDITSSKILALSRFDARAYAVASLFVTCRLAAIGILPSTIRQACPHTSGGYALKEPEAPAHPSRSKKLRHVDTLTTADG
ncbi:hypothetical protein VR010_15495 [Actinomycetaceae bacterium L2_0104]